MITAEDAEFHGRDPEDPHWAETRVLVFSVPEAGVLGNAYVLARPNVGAVISEITIQQGVALHPYEMDFHDPQMHLPCPPSFQWFMLGNGLTLHAVRPPYDYDYDYSYQHQLGSRSFELHEL